MNSRVSVVINTFNEEANITKAIRSVKWADEIIVCDMHSTDRTADLAEKSGAQVIYHKYTGYVEPARNYAISKATGDWILILDADEQIPSSLGHFLQQIIQKDMASNFIEIPRKNIIFGKWMKASMWWPDYHIRFFKKGTITWQDEIHSKPLTVGVGMNLPAEAKWAIIHQNYESATQFIERMNRYSTIQATELLKQRTKFTWMELINKPVSEFLSRFFAQRGFEDGFHGLALSLLQAFSYMLVYIKLWEMGGFKQVELNFQDLKIQFRITAVEVDYWLRYGNLPKNRFKRFFAKLKNKFS